MTIPFRLYVIAEGKGVRDEVPLLAAKAKTDIGLYWREPTASDVSTLPAEIAAFRTPLFVKESDLAGWPRLRAEGGVAGVHLKSDSATDPAVLRKRFARPILIARAIHSREDGRKARDEGADFAVFGHVYESESKPGAAGRGLDALRDVCSAAGKLPIFALGGLTPERIAEVLGAGAYGVATKSAFWGTRERRDQLASWLAKLDVPAASSR